MGLKKIPKDVWMKFSEDEKRFHELEYKKAFERNKRLIIITTRTLALFFILGLFFIGFAMLNAVKEYGQIKDKYGDEAFCYLCGLESKKKCECQYQSMIYVHDDFMLTEEYAISLAEYNAEDCQYSKVIGSQGNTDVKNNISVINFTFPTPNN